MCVEPVSHRTQLVVVAVHVIVAARGRSRPIFFTATPAVTILIEGLRITETQVELVVLIRVVDGEALDGDEHDVSVFVGGQHGVVTNLAVERDGECPGLITGGLRDELLSRGVRDCDPSADERSTFDRHGVPADDDGLRSDVRAGVADGGVNLLDRVGGGDRRRADRIADAAGQQSEQHEHGGDENHHRME